MWAQECMMQLFFVFKGEERSGRPWRREHFRSNTRKNLLKLRALSLMIWELPSLPCFFPQPYSKTETTILVNNSGQSPRFSGLLLYFKKFIRWVQQVSSMTGLFPSLSQSQTSLLTRNRILFLTLLRVPKPVPQLVMSQGTVSLAWRCLAGWNFWMAFPTRGI